MKSWIINHKRNFITTLIGAVAGFFYWYYVGCATGTCAITSVWYRTVLYGALMGWLLGDIVFKQDKNNSNEN